MDYYTKNADEFIERTKDIDLSTLYSKFENKLDGKEILEIGFGSGRDSLYFAKNYNVISIDSNKEFVKRAKKLLTNEVIELDVLDMDYHSKFNGIWACASLLHLSSINLSKGLSNCLDALKDNGILYMSFKYGEFEGERNGRYFNDMTEEKFMRVSEQLTFADIEFFITDDHRESNDGRWLNIFIRR